MEERCNTTIAIPATAIAELSPEPFISSAMYMLIPKIYSTGIEKYILNLPTFSLTSGGSF